MWMKREIIQEIKSKIKEIEKNLLGLGLKSKGCISLLSTSCLWVICLVWENDCLEIGCVFQTKLGNFGNVYKRL